jgi:hypothetical protein
MKFVHSRICAHQIYARVYKDLRIADEKCGLVYKDLRIADEKCGLVYKDLRIADEKCGLVATYGLLRIIRAKIQNQDG